ncbi:MAG: ATP-binding protein, partial [Anaerolineales bacterium]|nr:ATP-binding protein [Anaerolineales bacterium]
SDMRPLELARAIREEQQATADDVTTLAQIGITAAYRRKLATLPDKLIYELETYRLPDLPDIALKVGEEYRSLTPPLGVPGLSMGQKCTAILSIILVERNTPLVIDQPEDDLDNAFIFREIVQTLRREKERRQFIIATHNANIPVSGDAELIILMNANEEHGWAAYRGSIDDHAIRGPVETILEGGREAFLLRQAKYSMVNY